GFAHPETVQQPSRQRATHLAAGFDEARPAAVHMLLPGRRRGQPVHRQRRVPAFQALPQQDVRQHPRSGRQQNKDEHYKPPTSTISSKISVGRLSPAPCSFSLKCGRIPVAQKRPRTLPSGARPRFSKTKISCKVTMSPSRPVTSVMLVTRREPSLKREHCTRIWTAEAICWRTAVSCMLALASATITSSREMASRGVLACTVGSEPSRPAFMGDNM